MMFSIRSFVLYAVGTSMCGGLLVLLCLPLCALLRRLRAPSKLLCLLWLAVGLRFLLPGGIPVSIRQPGHAAPIRQATAAVQALTVPAELRRRLCRVRQAVPPCPAAPLTFGYCWQQSGPPGLWFYWCARQLAIAACAAWWPLPAKHRMAATPAPRLPRRSHLACCTPAFICRKACRVPTPCGTAA